MADPPADYTQWSNNDLIKRITDLEGQVRSQTLAHRTRSPSRNTSTPFKKPKKPPKPFDSSKYHTRLIALKFAYLGGRYNGLEYHVGNKTPKPTIEEELWKALVKTRLIFPQSGNGQSQEEVCWDGCEYSKCGRTDRGVSAFGQVIGVRVRSNRPKSESRKGELNAGMEDDTSLPLDSKMDIDGRSHTSHGDATVNWDPVKDELPYVQQLNRVLPEDIRILAWCPNPPTDFSARFNCRERRYRYFFTNPAYAPTPAASPTDKMEGWLDIEAMQMAAKNLEGLHDFRNFCKIDPSKQITNFQRRIFHSSIQPVSADQSPSAFLARPPFAEDRGSREPFSRSAIQPEGYYFEVRGSAFLWHQVRHMVAILFLVGQGHEDPNVVKDLLDVQKVPSRPVYEMASDAPLVLWDCIFPDLQGETTNSHMAEEGFAGYEDSMEWLYAGDEPDTPVGTGSRRTPTGVLNRKYGRMSIMEDVWALWRRRKMDELLSGSLMDVISRQGKSIAEIFQPDTLKSGELSARVFDGSEVPRTVGVYVPIMHRERLETPEIVNARYAARKGLNSAQDSSHLADVSD